MAGWRHIEVTAFRRRAMIIFRDQPHDSSAGQWLAGADLAAERELDSVEGQATPARAVRSCEWTLLVRVLIGGQCDATRATRQVVFQPSRFCPKLRWFGLAIEYFKRLIRTSAKEARRRAAAERTQADHQNHGLCQATAQKKEKEI